MNTRSRTLARLKLPDACRDNPELPRRFVLSMLMSMYKSNEAIKGGFLGPEATRKYIALKSILSPAAAHRRYNPPRESK